MNFITTLICCSLAMSLAAATKLPYNPKKGGTTTTDTVVVVPVHGSHGHHVPCNAVCNQFQVLNRALCRCEPNHNGIVNGNYYYNYNGYHNGNGYINGGHHCPNYYQCQSPRTLNHATCQCQCPVRQCPAGQIQDPNSCQCTCRRDIACPRGQIRDPFSCRCECERRGCPFPQIMNQDTCQCECARRFCSRPQFLNPATCQCECSSTSRRCDISRQRFNPDTCECDCTLVSVTVETTVPGIPAPVQPPSQIIGRFSRTPGGRIRSGSRGFGFPTFVGPNGLVNGGLINGVNGGGFFLGKRKRRALPVDNILDKKRFRRSHRTRARNAGLIFVNGPTQPIVSPPSVRTETRLIPGPCPAGTVLNRASCSCF